MSGTKPVVVLIEREHLAKLLGWGGHKIAAAWIDPGLPGIVHIRFDDVPYDGKWEWPERAAAEQWRWHPDSPAPEPPIVCS